MRGLDWSDLQVFLAMHRGRSVRAAAKATHLSHSTVSRRLACMERDLGAKLFIRSTEGLVATAASELILEHAERVETEIFALERQIRGHDVKLSGPLRITMTPPIADYLIMPQLGEFARLYPEIDLEIISTYDIADMSRHHADIAIRFQDKPDDHLFGRRWAEFADSVYATPTYIENHNFTGDNPTAQWIGFADSDKHPNWTRETPFSKCAVRHNVPEMQARLEATKAGIGMSRLPCFMADPSPGLMRVPGAGIVKKWQGWVLTHPDLKTTERVRVCVRFLIDAIDEHRDLIAGVGNPYAPKATNTPNPTIIADPACIHRLACINVIILPFKLLFT